MAGSAEWPCNAVSGNRAASPYENGVGKIRLGDTDVHVFAWDKRDMYYV
jgi:hypothetical protein